MIAEQFERRTFRIGKKNADERIQKLKARKEPEGWDLVDVNPITDHRVVIIVFERPMMGTRIKRRTPKGWIV